jgi:hypothetical protein
MQQPNIGSNLIFVAALITAVIAIARSPRKLHTFFFIIGAMLIGVGVGAVIGFALGNRSAGGTLAGILMSVGALAASIERIRRYRKTSPKYNVKPL